MNVCIKISSVTLGAKSPTNTEYSLPSVGGSSVGALKGLATVAPEAQLARKLRVELGMGTGALVALGVMTVKTRKASSGVCQTEQ